MTAARSNTKLYRKLIKDRLKLHAEPVKLQKDKIPIADRIQALKRIPQVESDLKAIEKAEREYNFSESYNLKDNFYKRYKLSDYCVSLNIPPSVIQIIRSDDIKSFLMPIHVKSCGLLGQNESWEPRHLSYDEICQRLDFFIPSDGKHLTIVIDLSKTETEIIAELKGIFKKDKKTVKKSESREKPFKFNKWEVYDMHTKEGMNFTQIARNKEGVEKHTHSSYNKDLDSLRLAVKRAYRKAEQIYMAVKKESNV
jgi:hypothetical protein